MYVLPRLKTTPTLPWTAIALVAIGLWLGACLLLDLAIVPSLYFAGMMNSAEFATMGASMFGAVNRAELLMGGLVLTSVLAAGYTGRLTGAAARTGAVLAATMLAIAAIETYLLTPDMLSLSASLAWPDVTATVPAAMDRMHGAYFAVDTLKVLAGALLLALGYRSYGPRSLPRG